MSTESTTTTYERQSDSASTAGWASRVRRSLRRFDRYTVEVMNPGHPYRLRTDRSA